MTRFSYITQSIQKHYFGVLRFLLIPNQDRIGQIEPQNDPRIFHMDSCQSQPIQIKYQVPPKKNTHETETFLIVSESC